VSKPIQHQRGKGGIDVFEEDYLGGGDSQNDDQKHESISDRGSQYASGPYFHEGALTAG
jgi:hypothetical protein